jgi:anti-anti-sigma factor
VPPVHARLTVALNGDPDLAPKADLSAVVAASRRSDAADIGIDLRGVDFLDSTALAAFALSRRVATFRGVRLRLSGPRPSVQRTLSVCGFAALCDIVVD